MGGNPVRKIRDLRQEEKEKLLFQAEEVSFSLNIASSMWYGTQRVFENESFENLNFLSHFLIIDLFFLFNLIWYNKQHSPSQAQAQGDRFAA